MNNQELGKKISQYLTHGANQLEAARLAALKAARERALAHYRVAQPVFVHAHADQNSPRWGDYIAHHPRLVMGGLLLAAVIATVSFWQSQEQHESSPIDAQILTSDLPLDAVTRQDFSEWLKDSSR